MNASYNFNVLYKILWRTFSEKIFLFNDFTEIKKNPTLNILRTWTVNIHNKDSTSDSDGQTNVETEDNYTGLL